MKITIYQIDAFTNDLFAGNPAAVCPLEEWLSAAMMQKIAAENNLSETAFFVKSETGFELRWFTPLVEVDLCGHATLASAHVIFNLLNYTHNQIKFFTKSGELAVSRNNDLITLNFPTSKLVPIEAPIELTKGLHREPVEVLKSRDIIAVFEKESDILSIDPDFESLKKLDCLGISISAPGDNVDFVSRFFAPVAGVNEDPVTGSAHTSLIPYWANRLKKNNLHTYQVSARQGELFCEYLNDRVNISGRAVTYLKGEIFISN